MASLTNFDDAHQQDEVPNLAISHRTVCQYNIFVQKCIKSQQNIFGDFNKAIKKVLSMKQQNEILYLTLILFVL